jgi:hypothetical protein
MAAAEQVRPPLVDPEETLSFIESGRSPAALKADSLSQQSMSLAFQTGQRAD